MVAEGCCFNGSGVEVPASKSHAVNEFVRIEGSVGSSGPSSSTRCLKTYKRQRQRLAKAASASRSVVEGGKVSLEAASRFEDQTYREQGGRSLQHSHSLANEDCNNTVKVSNFCPFMHWRNIVLEQMCDTLSECDGGLLGCIREAIVYHPDIDTAEVVKSSAHYHGDKDGCFSQKQWIPESSHKAAEGYPSVMSNGTLDEANHQTITKPCYHAFFSVIISEKFASLCKLLLENFQGVKVGSLFDFTLINSRMKEGAYERSPMLFSSDIQQVWGKLEKICFEMLSLAKSLSDISGNSCHEWVRGLADGTLDDGKKEESDSHAKLEQTGACGAYKVGTCRHCGDTADGKDCLVCDSCEEMYHVSCIEPAVVGIPLRSWYCAHCTAKGIGSPHEKCVVCERLNGPRCAINEVGVDYAPTFEEHNEHEESSDCFVEGSSLPAEGRDTDVCCKICESKVEIGEKLLVCSHPFCYLKYYHDSCLTSKQLESCGPLWYCPSCICRVCLTDQDDDKIVMCDGCNHAYHTYCMEPPRSSIPTGRWFCKKCAAGIQRIHKAKRKYAKLDEKWRNDELASKDLEEKRANFGDVVPSQAGVNMLLDAAKRLNYVEELAASR